MRRLSIPQTLMVSTLLTLMLLFPKYVSHLILIQREIIHQHFLLKVFIISIYFTSVFTPKFQR